MLEKRASIQAAVLPMGPLIQAVPPSCVEAATVGRNYKKKKSIFHESLISVCAVFARDVSALKETSRSSIWNEISAAVENPLDPLDPLVGSVELIATTRC